MIDKTLIVYLSRTGNTEKIARLIGKATGSRLIEITPFTPYSDVYSLLAQEVMEEIASGDHPKLAAEINFSEFDYIFVGTPNWCGTMAPPIATVLADNNTDGKVILPFCSHEGGGSDNIVADICKLCPNAQVYNILSVFKDGGERADDAVAEWLTKLDFTLTQEFAAELEAKRIAEEERRALLEAEQNAKIEKAENERISVEQARSTEDSRLSRSVEAVEDAFINLTEKCTANTANVENTAYGNAESESCESQPKD